MKRFASVLLSAVMLFSLAACTNGGASAAPSSSAASSASGSSQPPSSSANSREASSGGTSAENSGASSASSQSSTSEAAGTSAIAPESSSEAVTESSSETAPQAQSDAVPETESKILIAYFSKTGSTEAVAQQIQGLVGGDFVKIETATPYPEDYTETTELAKKELEEDARPQLSTTVSNMSEYDTLYIGYPIWWHTAPMAVYTFLESYDLSGKTVIPFCTSGGSEIDESMAAIKALCSNATVLEGLTANNSDDIQPWLKKIGVLE